MCKSKTKTAALDPAESTKSTSRTTNRPARTTKSSSLSSSTASRIPNKSVSSSSDPSTSYGSSYNFNTNSTFKDTSTTSTSSKTSLTSLRASLPEKTHIYDFSEIQQSTNNFLANRISSSSSAWRCAIRGKDAVVFQRRFRRPINAAEVGDLLSVICRSHHRSLVKLLGASISGDHIFLVYEHVSGASLSHCLRNPKNPNFTVLSDWMSRMQVAIDLAQGLEYIHHYTGLNLDLVHNHIESSSVIVTEPSFNAKICHFGTSELCGEITASKTHQKEDLVEKNSKIASISSHRDLKVEGTIAYMSPELRSEGIATQKSDVYAFGVVVLELLSGEEAMRVEFDGERGEFVRVSVIESAREAVDDESGDLGRVRRWMDGRLRDSYPVEVAEKMMRLCLDCCHVDPDQRPDMRRVAGKFSKFYLESRTWCEKRSVPTDFSISLAPR